MVLTLLIFLHAKGVLKMNQRKILNFVTPNINDKFSWTELNCTLRPMANILKCFSADYFTYFLLIESYLSIYCYKNSQGIERHYIDEHYSHYFKTLFGIDINKIAFTNKIEFINNVKCSIDASCPILVSVDLKELQYYEMYKVQHHDKNFTIYGYDLEKELFYILDNLHTKCVDDTILSPFVITFDEMYRMVVSYNEFYAKEKTPFYYEFVRKSKVLCSMNDTMSVLYKVLAQDDICFVYPEEDTYNKLCLSSEDDTYLTIELMCIKNNFRNVFYKLFNSICGKENVPTDELVALQEKIQLQWNKVRDNVIKFSYDNSLQDASFFSNEFKRIKKMEQDYRNLVIDIINSHQWKTERLTVKYDIINSLDCKILEKRNALRLELESEYIYDLWNVSNDGPQIYPTQDIRSLNVNLRTDVSNSANYQAGIIILDREGNRYMFGLFENSKLNVCCPSYGDDYELACVDFGVDTNFMQLEVTVNGTATVEFSYWTGERNTLLEYTLDNAIDKIGFFARSWGRTEGMIYFTDIKINGGEEYE